MTEIHRAGKLNHTHKEFSEVLGNLFADDFHYLESGAMVCIYFKTNHMPVRYLIYVAITALTRMLIGDLQFRRRPDKSDLLQS